MAAQSRGSAFPNTTAVSLADGGADDCAEEICQTGGTAGIYGMIFAHRAFVQNREIFLCFITYILLQSDTVLNATCSVYTPI